MQGVTALGFQRDRSVAAQIPLEGQADQEHVAFKTEALDELKARMVGSDLGAMLENVRTLIVLLDAEGALVGWNQSFDRLRKALPEVAIMQDFLSVTAAPDFLRVLQDVRQSGEPAHIRLDLGFLSRALGHDCSLIKTMDGHILLIADWGVESSDGLSELRAAALELEQLKAQLRETKQALDIKHTELQAVVAQADEVVHTDSLTFLPNRRSIVADLQRQVTQAERYGSPLSVSMIDLDYFKDVNDNYGHGAGDQVLRFIASEMRDSIRQPDMIGRYGGDEFLVVLPHTPLAAAAEQAARLCQQVRSNPFMAGNVEIKVSLSIGIAQYKPGADDWRSLLERADQALYQAKNAGRGQWAILEA